MEGGFGVWFLRLLGEFGRWEAFNVCYFYYVRVGLENFVEVMG